MGVQNYSDCLPLPRQAKLPRMKPAARRWIVGIAAAAALLVAVFAWLVHRYVPSDEELARRLSAGFEERSGIALQVGSVRWALRPVPVVEFEGLATGQAEPITVRRVVVHPRLSALWQRTISVDRLEIEGAVFPRASVRDFRGRFKGDPASETQPLLGGDWKLAEIPLDRLQLRDVTWIDRRGIALAYDADVQFDAAWRPRTAEISRVGVTPVAQARFERDGEQDRWRVLIDVGGGTWNGNAELRTLEGGRLRAEGRLSPQQVDIGGLTGAFKRNNSVAGRFSGETLLESEGDNPGDLVRNLHTRTRFSVRPATLKGFDLLKAVSTAGTDRSGQTVFDELSGTLETQSKDDGIVIRYTGLRARSGLLTASGSATVFNRRLDGEAAIDVVDGLVGVPFKLGGTLDKPQFSLTGGAATGAAIGTAVLPGVGTAIGARIGQKLEKLLDGDDDQQKSRPPARPNRSRPRAP
ncbi:AsmA-like C-terminal region [Burkholderiales bacterium 8X]|nr:AsmA-like C-terminal region [Burkholderiales bacterium 8X]